MGRCSGFRQLPLAFLSSALACLLLLTVATAFNLRGASEIPPMDAEEGGGAARKLLFGDEGDLGDAADTLDAVDTSDTVDDLAGTGVLDNSITNNVVLGGGGYGLVGGAGYHPGWGYGGGYYGNHGSRALAYRPVPVQVGVPVPVPVPVPVAAPAAPVPAPAAPAAPSRDEVIAALSGTWRGDGGGVGRPSHALPSLFDVTQAVCPLTPLPWSASLKPFCP